MLVCQNGVSVGLTACLWCVSTPVVCRELEGLLTEQCTVDTESSPGQSLPTVIGESSSPLSHYGLAQ